MDDEWTFLKKTSLPDRAFLLGSYFSFGNWVFYDAKNNSFGRPSRYFFNIFYFFK